MKFKSLLLLACAAILWVACKQNNSTTQKHGPTEPPAAGLSSADLPWAGDQDLVCEMKIDQSVTDTLHYNGKVYGFCGESCKESFKENPAKYAGK